MTSKTTTRLLEQVRRYLERQGMARAGERVGVAVSGGADSVALLLLLEELREKLGIVLSVVHFNHKLRGKASDADEKFVAMLAEERGLAFHAGRGNVAAEAKRKRANVEETGRRLRYEFFARLVADGRVNCVAVAHTADDQAETVLAHILRGTGLRGLGGIHPVSGPLAGALSGHIVRPVLGLRRAELRAYLKACKQRWREDATNLDTARMRARIRKKLIPLLEKQFQPAIVEHLATLADLAREDEAFFDAALEEQVATLVQKSGDGRRIPIAGLLRLVKKKGFSAEGTELAEGAEARDAKLAVSKRLVRRIVEEVKERPGQLTAQHVEAVLELARHGQSGKRLPLPGGLEVMRDLDAIVIRPQAAAGEASGNKTGRRAFEYQVELGEHGAAVRVAELGCVLRLRVIDWPPQARETSKDAAVLDRHRLREPLVLRNWRPGDAFRPVGHQGPHKLKRLFLEKRISRWEREGWPVLTSGGVLAWARGFPVAAEFAPDGRTRAGIVIVEEKL